MVRAENSTVSNTVSSGQNVTVVPCRGPERPLRGASPVTLSLPCGLPPSANVIV